MKKFGLVLFSVLSLVFSSCHFISSFTDPPEESVILSFDKTKAKVSIGSMEVINLKASKKQNSANISWTYDDSIVFAKTDNYSAVITGLKPGTTTIKASCGDNSASCLVTVSNDSYTVSVTNPYVYASCDYVDVKPNETIKVSAALFGGTVADINGFSWSIDKNAVASLQTEGNYCWITGKNDGIAKVTVKHNKAAYGYSFLVNCASDGTAQSYITTSDNIITINTSQSDTAEFTVDLINPLVSDYASGFEFCVVDSLGNESPSKPVVITSSGNLHVNLKAFEVGECYVRCKHPNAAYSLDILVRVIAQAETAFIEISKNIVTVSDQSYENVSLSLLNYSKTVEPSLYSWSFSENAEDYIDFKILNGNSNLTGDNIEIIGKKNGSVKVTVSYPGVPSRSFVVLVRNIASKASDATCYITTSQNYIRMIPGEEPQRIDITLKNASQSDINDLKWTITNEAADGSASKVINWKSGNGSFLNKFATRSVLADVASAYAIIEPLNIGTAYIDVTHPKAIYSTRIKVIVAPEKTKEAAKSYLNLSSTSSVISVKNGEEKTVNISFSGEGSLQDILWRSEGKISVNGNGTECVITSPASGSGPSKSTITVTHPNSDYPLKITVACYDNSEDLNEIALKSIYSYKTNENITTNQTVKFYLETMGFETTPAISWKVEEGSSLVAVETENNNKTLSVSALKAGKSVIKASCPECDDVYFIVKITDEGIVDESKDCYLSTSQNVLYFEDINQSRSFNVELFNISSFAYNKLDYKLSNSNYEVSFNNNNFTVTSLVSNGNATLTITHPLSQNDLTINLRTGNQLEYINEDVCYISTNKDVFELFAGQEDVALIATINHTQQSDSSSIPKGFTFKSEDESIATVSYVNFSNTCYIKPIKDGTTKIFVKNPDAQFEKEVVVIVKQSPTSSTIPYITTKQNVITAIQGNYVTATVTLKNLDSIDNSDWLWTSVDSRCVDVVANNGTSALLSANSPGTTQIKITHKKCPYPLKITVTVLDSGVISSRPHIFTDSNIITLQKGLSTTLKASMIGGKGESDNNYFRFQSSNPSLILVNSVSDAAYIKALNTGIAYVTIYNSRYTDSYSKTVLVIIEDKQEEGVYIKPSQKILKLKPDEDSFSTVTATLVNGDATDGKDFIWWADDYNLIGINAVAEQCSVIPAGRSGTTKLHVKHAKASKQADILVMVSNYDTFAFEKKSANISSDKLYFFPLQVPSVEEPYEVKYSSSNEKVCIIQGSNSVAWVCGLSYGTASLTASMYASDGTVMATSEMLVSVTAVEPSVPVISLGNSIITVEAGTSKTFSAVITGEGLSGSEKFNLKWSVENKEDGISLLDENADKIAYGSDVHVTFNHGGEYVLKCEHEKSGAMQQIYIIVEEKGEVLINLNSTLETVYKDDGSFTLTAHLTNGTDADYKTISWSSVKVGGQNIVAVSKTKGPTCTVTPKAVGQTQVIAKLPNGKFAICTVIVKANAEIKFDTGTIHVIPGYTEIVNYTTNPENATINWISQMTIGSSGFAGGITNYFTIEDDTAKKQLRITGVKDYPGGVAGTVTASMVGASSANLPSLKVYVEYKCELNVMDTKGNILTLLSNNNPDTKNAKKFQVSYYPTDLEIDILKGSQVVACIPDSGSGLCTNVTGIPEISIGNVTKQIKLDEKDGIKKVFMSLDVIPHKECDFDLTVRATLPRDKERRYTTEKSFYYSAYYDNYDIEVVDMTHSGAFTGFNRDSRGQITGLTLSDGEEAVFYFKIKNENAIGNIKSLEKSSWVTPSTKKELEYCSDNSIYTKNRADKANYFFKLENTKISKNVNRSPDKGMIYFYCDDGSSSTSEKIYHLGHAWDYYKDLPPQISSDGQSEDRWELYKKTNNYTNTFLSDLSNNGVDYWLVSKEPVWKGYYAIPRPGKRQINAEYKSWNEHESYWYKLEGKIRKSLGNLQINYNGVKVFHIENRDNPGNKDISITDLLYAPCTPFVISTNELASNNVLVRPNDYWIVSYSRNSDSNSMKMQKLIMDYITPAVLPYDEATRVGNGSLIINYTKGKDPKPLSKEIPVNIIRHNCKAYTNGSWESEMNGKHWVMKNFADPGSLSFPPYFFVDEHDMSGTTTQLYLKPDLLKINYTVFPKTESVQVIIPDKKYGKLELKSAYSSVTTQNGSKIYTINSHDKYRNDEFGNTIGTGTLSFKCTGTYDGNIYVCVPGQNKKEEISVSIKAEDFFISEIDSKYATGSNTSTSLYSYVDESAHLLVVGDGETVTGKFINKNPYSSTKINSVRYESFTSDSKIQEDTNEDLSGNLQKELVTVAVSSSRDSNVIEGNQKYGPKKEYFNVSVNDNSASFTINHSKDYGYFATANSVTDEFYNKRFTLNDVSKTGTKEARLKELDSLKKTYASNNAGIAKTSYEFPYYWKAREDYQSSKTYELTPIGRFIITTGDDDDDDNCESFEIILCVKVTDDSCAATSQYGNAVPESYYLK
ncbi:hypothetical protein [Treponema pectinovorum]|uniref:hypothetical protein n=1 Tax=Treponema pectinovorum TaxID=164 RepID=UPI0011F0E2C6|nr:hypothetical protein [Treponema pectinovorum]